MKNGSLVLKREHIWCFIFLVIILNCSFHSAISLSSVFNRVNENTTFNQTPTLDNRISVENISSENISPHEVITKITSYDDEDIPFNITSTGHEFNGYNLFVLQITNTTNPRDLYAKLLITDMNGKIINKLERTAGKWAFAHFINATTVLFLSYTDAAYLWNVYTDTVSRKTLIDAHHDITYNNQTNTYLYLREFITTIDDITYQYDQIVEENENGDVIWSLNTTSFIPTYYWNGIEYIQDRADITHTNTVFWDFDEDIIYAHMRNLNTFYKINHSNGEILWGLGEYGNFTLFNQRGEIVENLFYHGHAVEKIDDNRFIIFDNDFFNTTQSDMISERQSRIVEIVIDETTMTANESWHWLAPQSYFSRHLGDADKLPNGNRLGLFGAAVHPNTNIGARLVEVDEEGNIDWEMNFPNDDYKYDIYQAERFRFSPVIAYQDDIFTSKNIDVNVTWQTWYNFRTKGEMTGSYEIYLDGSLIDSNTHVFDKFWRPTNLTVNLGKLNYGVYNLTLALFDEDGHFTVDTINITSVPFYIFRNSLEYIEKGQDNSEIMWTGDTTSPLDYEIKSNESIIDTDSWLGEDITLDGNSLTNGLHFIQFLLYNNSILVHNDSFWFPVYPIQNPLILSSPDDFIIPRNQSSLLSWNLFDNSPNYYEIYLNNTLRASDFWVNQSEIINWNLPLLEEGIYNLTLIAYDQLLQSSSALTWITVMPPSPPIISYQSSYQIIWGEDTNLTWEILGGHTWTLYKNKILFQSEPLSSNVIQLEINDWYSPDWHPGDYNLTLVVKDIFDKVSSLSILLEIIIDFSDPYIDSFIESHSIFYLNGENIIDAPDSSFASIYSDYSNGYITGDMGDQEEILDGLGDDFEIIAYGGEYQIWVSNDLSQLFTLLTSGSGNMTFDLATIGFSKARYIRIEYRSGGIVNVDAVIAINYNQVKVDSTPPEITGPYDFTLYNNQTSVFINWTVYDKTPYNFTISVNNIIVASDFWNGSDIQYEYFIEETGIYNVTLTLLDIFGNSANDTVKVIIVSSNPLSRGAIIALSISGSVVTLTSLVLFTRFKIKKKRQTDK